MLAVFAALLAAACGSDGAEGPGSREQDMFSLFKKKAGTETTVHPAVNAALQPLDAWPDPVSDTDTNPCRKVRVDGDLPDAQLVDDPDRVVMDGLGFVVDGGTPGAPFLIANRRGAPGMDRWPLDGSGRVSGAAGALPAFDPAQDQWVNYSAFDMACLPGGRLLIALVYVDQGPEAALYLYDPAADTIDRLGPAEARAHGDRAYFETRQAGPSAMLVLTYADTRREAAEIYHNHYNHLTLYSPAHPGGQPILKLGIDSGNVADWFVRDGVAYLTTIDRRKNSDRQPRYWSLDLAALLDPA